MEVVPEAKPDVDGLQNALSGLGYPPLKARGEACSRAPGGRKSSDETVQTRLSAYSSERYTDCRWTVLLLCHALHKSPYGTFRQGSNRVSGVRSRSARYRSAWKNLPTECRPLCSGRCSNRRSASTSVARDVETLRSTRKDLKNPFPVRMFVQPFYPIMTHYPARKCQKQLATTLR